MFFVFIFLCGVMYFYFSGKNYQHYFGYKDVFIKSELSKIKSYSPGEGETINGFFVLYVPPPMSFIFEDRPGKIYAPVANSHSPVFRYFWPIDSYSYRLDGFSNVIICITITGLMVFFGVLGDEDDKERDVYVCRRPYSSRTAIARMLFLDILLVGIFLFLYLLSGLFGFRLFCSDSWSLLPFAIYSVLFANFFYALANLSRVLFKRISDGGTAAAAAMVFLIFFLPPLISHFLRPTSPPPVEAGKKKPDTVADINYPAAQGAHIFNLNESKTIEDYRLEKIMEEMEWEQEFIDSARKAGRKRGYYAAIFPTTFFNHFSHEVSCISNRAYMDFFQYSLELKKKWVEFFVRKKSYKFISTGGSESGKSKQNKNVEEFITPDMMIYHAGSHIPHSFVLGVSLTLLYTFILFLLFYFFNLKRNIQVEKERVTREAEMQKWRSRMQEISNIKG